MPSLSEFTLSIRLRRDRESEALFMVFRFATLREFRSFRYEIQVEDLFDPETREIDFKIHGVQAPTNLMPAAGAAGAEIAYPALDGIYRVTLAGARRIESFAIAVAGDEIKLVGPPGLESPRIVIEKGVENVRI